MHLGDTYSFRECKRANTSLECPKSNNLECRQTDTVPDPNVRLQCLKATEDTLNIIGCYDPHAMFVLFFFFKLKRPPTIHNVLFNAGSTLYVSDVSRKNMRKFNPLYVPPVSFFSSSICKHPVSVFRIILASWKISVLP